MSCCWMVGVGMTDFILNVPDEEFVRGVREGRKSERERIIHLLETASDCRCSPDYGVDYDNYCYCDALAIIKGENK